MGFQLRKVSVRSLLVAVGLAAGMMLCTQAREAKAWPPCGSCSDGTSGANWACAGAATNCSECTVCSPPRI